MWDDDDNDEQNFLVNPSRTAMQQLGPELRALVDTNDDVYVWRTETCTHSAFASKHNLTGKVWVYIDPAKAVVTVSSYSHCGAMDEARQYVKSHRRFKFFTVGLDEEKLDEVTQEDVELLQHLGVM